MIVAASGIRVPSRPMRPSSTALSLCLALACTAKSEPTPEPSKPADEVIEVATRQAPKVAVIDAGTEPRRTLVLHPAAGSTERLELRTDMRISMDQGAGASPMMTMPTAVTRMASTIEQVDGGFFSVAQGVESVEVLAAPGIDAKVVAQMRASMDPLVGYKAVLRMDERGVVRGGTVTIPGDAQPLVKTTMLQLSENLGQLSVPLPAEPVGVGARWTSESHVEQGGMKLRQDAAYTLAALEGEHVVIEASLVQSLEDPTITPPGMFGATAHVGEFASSGKGRLELDLDHLTPSAVTLDLDLHMKMEMKVLGQEQRIGMDMGITLAMTRP